MSHERAPKPLACRFKSAELAEHHQVTSGADILALNLSGRRHTILVEMACHRTRPKFLALMKQHGKWQGFFEGCQRLSRSQLRKEALCAHPNLLAGGAGLPLPNARLTEWRSEGCFRSLLKAKI